MCGEAVPAAAIRRGLGHENPIAWLPPRVRVSRGGDSGALVQPLSPRLPAVHPGRANPVKSPSRPALRQGSQLDGKLMPSSFWARVAFHMQYFIEPETSSPFPPLLQEQGRTDPNSSESLWPFACGGRWTLPPLPKHQPKERSCGTAPAWTMAMPEPGDGLLEVLVPS